MAVTIKQVAEAAGVSRGTVDRALHNRKGVSENVAGHVREVAERLGYFPNRAGRMLAALKQPLTIGCVLPNIGNVFYNDVIKGLKMAQAEMNDFGVTVKIREIRGFDAQDHINAINEAAQSGVNALCVSSIDTPEIRACINRIVDSGMPVVTVNNDLSGTKRLCYVGSDYLAAGKTAAGMISLYREKKPFKLLIATGSMKVKGHNERIRGFNQTLKKNRAGYELVDIFETQDDDGIAYELTAASLKEHGDINCVYITGAGVVGVCKAVEELPEKRRAVMRVLCFDDITPHRKYLKQGVIDFVICQEPIEQGYQSVKKLFDYFMNGRKQTPKDHITGAVIKIKENVNPIR